MRFRRVCLLLCVLSLTGCAEVLPGMLRESSVPDSAPDQQQSGTPSGLSQTCDSCKNTESQPRPRFVLVPVRADTVVKLSNEADSQFDSLADLPGILPSDVPPEYLIGPGDIVYVTVWDHPELTSVGNMAGPLVDPVQYGHIVDPDGKMYFPYAGRVQAAGISCRELRETLVQALQPSIKNAQVEVKILVHHAERILVTGEVKNPQTLQLNEYPQGVLEAINFAGGLTANASRRRLLLIRQGKTYQINFAKLLSGALAEYNVKLEPGDILNVPDQSLDEVFVLGEVTTPQPVFMKQDRISVFDALTQAGGLDRGRAKGSGVLIFRSNSAVGQKNQPPGPPTVYAIDLSNPEGVLVASRFPLRAFDVVYVSPTLLASYNDVINQILPTVTTVFELMEINSLSKTNTY